METDENPGENNQKYPGSSDSKSKLQPCLCILCKGKLRDRRTIRKHLLSHPYLSGNVCKLNDEETSVLDLNVTIHASGSYVYNSPSETLLMTGNNPSNASTQQLSDDNASVSEDDADVVNISNPSSPTPPHETDEEDEIDKDMERCILRILDSKVKYGWSQGETLTQLQSLYELAEDYHIPHKSWCAVMSFLKKLGYKNPQHFKVCCGNDHVILIEYDEYPVCHTSREQCVDYFVLGLNLKSAFLSTSKVKCHLAHWEEKDDWFNVENIDVPYKEVWHGSRFRELSYFWDEERDIVMPTTCPNCYNIISVEEMTQSAGVDGLINTNKVNLSCSECTFDFIHTIESLKGSPLNQAFIFHEDGFNAFSTKSRGIAAIHVSDACTKKEQRLQGKNLHVYSFIPTFLLKEGIPHKIDAFLKPLIDEITELYLTGIDVQIPEAIQLSNNYTVTQGNHKVRALMLLGTADLKGHQEIILYAGGGKIGCRRCLVNGIYIPCKRHYYYGKFGERYRNPSAPRTAAYQLENGKRVDSAKTAARRQEIKTATGVCGASILFDLYKLYKFDPVMDMTIDRMHLTFNMLKREFLEKMWSDLGDNSEKAVNDRNPEDGGLLNRGDFQCALQCIKWTAEEKAKGVARMKTLTDKLGGWKSNEYKRFSSVAKVVLAHKVHSKAYDCYNLLCNAVQMLYSTHLQAAGWQNEHIIRLENLLWAHAIRAEEFYGLAICTENLEYSVHAAQDIRRHSSMDNYSCELYERAILRHKEQKHNAKGLEKTYTTRENMRNFLNDYQDKNGPLTQYGLDKVRYTTSLDGMREPIQLHESSFSSAKALLNDMKEIPNPSGSVQHAISYGVAVGYMKRKLFQASAIADLNRFFARNGIAAHNIPNYLSSLKCVALRDEVGDVEKFTKGTTCKIGSDDNEWIMEISDIFQVGPVDNRYYTFVNGKYFIPLIDNGNIVYHSWTESPKLIARSYIRDSVQPACNVRRKIILYPDPSDLENPQFFLCIDFKKPEIIKEVNVPLYPQVEETVHIMGTAHQVWYGLIRNVDNETRNATVLWYKESRRQGVWTITNQEDRIPFSSVVKICKVVRVFGGYNIV